MIEPMKKVALVAMRADRDGSLTALRALEIIHLRPVAGTGEESAELASSLAACDSLKSALQNLKNFEAKGPAKPGDYSRLSPEDLAQSAEKLLEENGAQQEIRDTLARQLAELAPWGEFDPADLRRLREKGLQVYLCAYPKAQVPELPEHAVKQVIARSKNMVFLAVVSDRPLEVEVPELRLPEEAPAKLREQLRECEEKIAGLEAELGKIAQVVPQLEAALLAREDAAEFNRAREGMGEADELLYLTGYIPTRREAELKQAAARNGWALLLEEPEESDRNVPTLLTVPRWLRIAVPLFDFVGIRPGYHEFDVSAWFVIFFAIFFAMIFGDAGYGTVFVLATLIAKLSLGRKHAVALNLILILSVCTVIWGALSGNWFGIDNKLLPISMQGLPWCRETKNVQYLCFIIGAVHLSIAHAWKALVAIPSLRCLAQFGWIMVLWGNFFLGSMLVTGRKFPSQAKWLYIAGGVLILLFTKPSKRLLRTVGSGVGAIVGKGVNSFVDLLSYIRLFAVGLSSFYVAKSFNDMGLMLRGNILTMVFGVLLILIGHTLNITLCTLGVLVHGIRLNTLEFSGHLDLEWAGIPFKAFARRSSTTDKP